MLVPFNSATWQASRRIRSCRTSSCLAYQRSSFSRPAEGEVMVRLQYRPREMRGKRRGAPCGAARRQSLHQPVAHRRRTTTMQGAALAPPCATCRTCHRLSPSIWRLRKNSRRPTACAASASLSAALDQTKRNALPRSRCSKKQRRQLAQRYRAKALRAALLVAEAREAPELEAPLNIPLALSASDLDLTWGAKRQQLHTTRSRCARTVCRATSTLRPL